MGPDEEGNVPSHSDGSVLRNSNASTNLNGPILRFHYRFHYRDAHEVGAT
jgi:hypothetical protein